MIANIMQSLNLNNLAVGWFDGVLVAVLGLGIFRGRKNGMSKEFLPTLQWLAIVFVCGLFYSMLGKLILRFTSMDQLTDNLLAYAMLALVVFFIFSLLKRTIGLKLFGSNIFGGAEYYLGMPSGMIRFACILLFGLAFLNARGYTSAQINAANAYQTRWYGAHYFPNLYNVQNEVFKESFTGPYIKDYLGVLLIKPTTLTGNHQLAQNVPAE